MNYYPFDSRNPLYKGHIGAIKEDEELKLRLLLHKDALCHDAFLIIQKDCEDVMEYKMQRAEYLEDYQFFDITLNLSEGIYWYYFRYTSSHGEFFVTKTDTSLGIVSDRCQKWQQTVYLKDFVTPDWLSGGLIYQIFPDRFFGSGKQKQNVPSDRFIQTDKTAKPQHIQSCDLYSLGNDYYCGDLKGIEQKLDYLKSLGVTCIYLNPIFEAHSNHRYNTADYMKVDPLLGDTEDLKSLCSSAKRMGIRVILDGVFSHTGDDSLYFDRHHRYGGKGAFDNPDSPFRNWYTFGNFNCGYSAWWGVPSLPQVNENNPDFTEFITGENGVIRHWLRQGISGWRLDVADELPDEFLDKIRSSMKEQMPDSFLLGEVWEDASNKISYGSRRRFLRGKQLDSVMNYPFKDAIIDFVCNSDAEKLNKTVLDITENYPPCCVRLLMNHIGTHDTARAITAIARYGTHWGDRNCQATQELSHEEYMNALPRLKAAAVIQFTLPGVPSIYYGDEVGAQGFLDPFCRGFHPWENGDTELLEFYRALGEIRKNEAFKDGDYIPVLAEQGHIVYIRQTKNSKVLIAVNCGEYFEMPLQDTSLNTKYFGTAPENNIL
ncbi:MAG: glycoside hydrolase family 13 protein, partial [Clostridia bacterium]|nr:glycoside hydrolase family 13 protein [Clostridia bacterium]